jgi:hypothetical protein
LAHAVGDLLGDLARRPAQLARERQRNRAGQVAVLRELGTLQFDGARRSA